MTVRELIGRDIRNFSTVIFGVKADATGTAGRPLGSGTLVQIGNRRAILTAGHVCKNSLWDLTINRDFQAIGLCLTEYSHNVQIKIDTLAIVGEWNLEQSDDAHDWGLIFLPEQLLSSVSAIKSFFVLDNAPRRFDWDAIYDSCWVLGGAPAELYIETIDKASDEQHWNLEFILGFAGIFKPASNSTTTFVDAQITKDQFYRGPKRFNGVSGGGLWYSQLTESSPGIIVASPAQFCGVPFFEIPHDDINIAIRCQTITSILERLDGSNQKSL